MVIEKQPEANEPGRPQSRVMWQHEVYRSDDVRRGLVAPDSATSTDYGDVVYVRGQHALPLEGTANSRFRNLFFLP
jgi:hypothetical protein